MSSVDFLCCEKRMLCALNARKTKPRLLGFFSSSFFSNPGLDFYFMWENDVFYTKFKITARYCVVVGVNVGLPFFCSVFFYLTFLLLHFMCTVRSTYSLYVLPGIFFLEKTPNSSVTITKEYQKYSSSRSSDPLYNAG